MFGVNNQKGEAAKLVDSVEVDAKVLLASNDGSPKKELVGSIDQGTSSTRFLLFTKEGRIAAWAQLETTQIFPTSQPYMVGWHEQDPFGIWETVVKCIRAVIEAMDKQLKKHSYSVFQSYSISAIGITNQRESTIAWNSETGQVYYNAIIWDDTRTVEIAKDIAGTGGKDKLRPKTGLPLASYFAGTKVRWLLDNVQALREDLSTKPETVRFGTVDTWVLYQLTGAPAAKKANPLKKVANVGGIHVTDVTNAARWLFLDIDTVEWDEGLVEAVCGPHKVPLTALPKVMASSEVYGTLKKESTGVAKLEGVPVSAILGDQQAALFGQVAFEVGEAKNTYGTGMFLMMNTGTNLVPSKHGLLTTIAYKYNDEVVYALEGSVSHSGSTIQWLRDQLGIIEKASDTSKIATETNDGLYLVPAFAGLFAPHWRSDARGCIVGITAAHHKGHFARAALEASAYMARELFDAIKADSGVALKALKVDGGGSHNKLMMQFQSDMIEAPVVIPEVQETTAMGAAFSAGLAVGFWKDQDEIRALWEVSKSYTPSMSAENRDKNWAGWKKAITRSLNWVENSPEDDEFFDAEESHSESGAVNKSLLLVAAVGAAAGFLLGRQKR